MEKTLDTTARPTIEADKTRIDTKHIDVLDGVRALAVFGVLWFHFWQQNWIMPYINAPFLARIGLPTTINLLLFRARDFCLSTGCCFSPRFAFFCRMCVRRWIKPRCPTRSFFIKRVARIVPSYLFAVLVIFFAVSPCPGRIARFMRR